MSLLHIIEAAAAIRAVPGRQHGDWRTSQQRPLSVRCEISSCRVFHVFDSRVEASIAAKVDHPAFHFCEPSVLPISV